MSSIVPPPSRLATPKSFWICDELPGPSLSPFPSRKYEPDETTMPPSAGSPAATSLIGFFSAPGGRLTTSPADRRSLRVPVRGRAPVPRTVRSVPGQRRDDRGAAPRLSGDSARRREHERIGDAAREHVRPPAIERQDRRILAADRHEHRIVRARLVRPVDRAFERPVAGEMRAGEDQIARRARRCGAGDRLAHALAAGRDDRHARVPARRDANGVAGLPRGAMVDGCPPAFTLTSRADHFTTKG